MLYFHYNFEIRPVKILVGTILVLSVIACSFVCGMWLSGLGEDCCRKLRLETVLS